MKRSTIVRTSAIGATCALAGAAAGIAGTSAATPSPGEHPGLHRWLRLAPLGGPGIEMAVPGDAAGLPVHSDTVIPNEKGGFDTITMDRGMFSSLSGQKLTITEGTKSATYGSVTLTIPSDATVRRNGETAQLSDIKSGDTVMVMQSPKGTVVDAFDAQHEPQMRIKIPRPPEGPLAKKYGEGPPPPAPGAPPAGPTEGSGPGSSSSEGTEGRS
jgi:hypothetical protein